MSSCCSRKRICGENRRGKTINNHCEDEWVLEKEPTVVLLPMQENKTVNVRRKW